MHIMHNYYIALNASTIQPNDLKAGERIFKMPFSFFENFAEDGEGPYLSLRSLKRNSSIFKALLQKNSKRAKQILEDKNIITVENYIYINGRDSFSPKIIELFEHSTRGNVSKDKISGIHFFRNKQMRIVEIIKPENTLGIWKAKIEVFRNDKNEWFEKTSTFFPLSWDLRKLLYECDYCYKTMIKDQSRVSVHKSVTTCGVPVEIIINNEKIKSIYPLYIDDN